MKDIPNFLVDINLEYLLYLARKVEMRKFLLSLTTSQFKYPEMNPDTRVYLRNIFDNHTKNLGKFLDRDLTHRV